MHKKWISILFFACLAGPFVGTFVWLQMEKLQVRAEMKKRLLAGLDDDQLIKLKFSKAEAEKQLEWEHEKEFSFENRMYDVVRKRVEGDSLYLLCWPDEAETKIDHQLEWLADEILGNDPESKKRKKRLATFIKSFYEKEASHRLLFWSHQDPMRKFRYLPPGSTLAIAPPVPPPWIV